MNPPLYCQKPASTFSLHGLEDFNPMHRKPTANPRHDKKEHKVKVTKFLIIGRDGEEVGWKNVTVS